MQDHWAEDNLTVIRVLMESAAVYRRALAPVCVSVGLTGLAAGGIGAALDLETPRLLVGYWLVVAGFCALTTFLIIRRQALAQREPFWTPPTTRVALALLPGFFAGVAIGALFWFVNPGDPPTLLFLPASWMLCFGLAMHAAGFFMMRGVRLFAWIFILCGLSGSGALLVLSAGPDFTLPHIPFGNLAMGVIFGGGHALYGGYLYLTRPRGAVA